jgi:hypothetical protein
MRIIASLLVVLAIGCVSSEEPATATAVGELTQATDSVIWTAGGTCGSVPCDGNFIWPSGLGITSAYAMIRSAPDMSGDAAYFAFVVWNGSTVGRILQVQAGAPNGTDLRATISNIEATRTFSFPDRTTGSTGNGGSTPTPQPHPNVDGTFHFSTKFLTGSVVPRAAAIQVATENFVNAAFE